MSPDLLLFCATSVSLQVLAKTLINEKPACDFYKQIGCSPRARNENCDCTLLYSKIMFKNFSNNSLIHVLILTARALWRKGNNQEKKNDLRNALGCYTEAIDVKCKDYKLNFILCWARFSIHNLLGEFRRHICFPFKVSELKYLSSECKN